MKTEKILINFDRNGFTTFQKNVQSTCDAANSLISIFHEFQPWLRVTSLDQFTELVSNPKKYFDDTIVVNVHVTARGMTVDPEQAARLFNISRDLYNNAVSGMPLVMDDCPECQRAKVVPGRKAVSLYTFEQYKSYLIFTDGNFTVNTEAVDADLDKFNFYISTPEEIEIYNLYHDTVKLLNKFTALSPISTTERETIKSALKFHLSQGHQGDFLVNPETLKNAINKLKYQQK